MALHPVALQVRHPGVHAVMHRDFALMQAAAWLSTQIPGLRDLHLDESVRQFGESATRFTVNPEPPGSFASMMSHPHPLPASLNHMPIR